MLVPVLILDAFDCVGIHRALVLHQLNITRIIKSSLVLFLYRATACSTFSANPSYEVPNHS